LIDREPLPEGFAVLAYVAKSLDSAISAPMGLVALLVHFEFHLKRRGAE